MNAELEKAFAELEENTKKDEKLLIIKNNSLHILKKDNDKLKKIVATLKKRISELEDKDYKPDGDESKLEDSSQLTINQSRMDESSFLSGMEDEELEYVGEELPPELLEHEKSLERLNHEREEELTHMEREIQ